MVTKLKESEAKLQSILDDRSPDNVEVPSEEINTSNNPVELENAAYRNAHIDTPMSESNADQGSSKIINENNSSTNLKKVTNIENEQLNKSLSNSKVNGVEIGKDPSKSEKSSEDTKDSGDVEIVELESIACGHNEQKYNDKSLNDELRKNILSCAEKAALIEELKSKNNDSGSLQQQVSWTIVTVLSYLSLIGT